MKDRMQKNLLGYGQYVVILILAMGIVYTLLNVTYENVKSKMIANLNERQLSHGRQAAKGIGTFIKNQISSLQQIAKDKHIMNLDEQGIAMMREYYESHKTDISIVTRIDGQGRIVFPIPYDAKVIHQPVTTMDDFEAVKRTHKVWISDVFINRRGHKAIMIQVPVLERKSFKGTLAVLLPFDAIAKRYVEDIKIGENGYAWVISRDGVELSCPVPGHEGKSVFINCREFPDILAMAHRMTRGEQGVTTYKFNRVRGDVVEKTVKHAVYFPVRLENTFWSIVIATPEDEVIAGLVDFRNRLMLIAALFLVFMGGLLFMMFRNQILLREVERRKKTEEAMLEKSEELDRYFTSSLDLLCIADFEGHFRRLNPEWEKILGYPLSELVGKCFLDFVHPDDLESTIATIGSLANKNAVLNFVNRYRHRSGSYRWIEWRSYPVENVIYAVARDITLRKQMEEELSESQRRLADIIEFLPDATFVIDRKGTVTAWNRAIADMTGINANEIVGKGDYEYTIPFYGERRPALIDLVLKPDDVYLKNQYQAILKQEDTLSAEVFVPKIKQGQGGYLWIIASKLYSGDGEVTGAIESIRDISEQKAMDEALRASELRFKELSDLLPEAVFEADLNMTITFVNKKAISLFGYTVSDIDKGLNAIDMIVPEDRDRAKEIVKKRVTGQWEGPVEYLALKKDGSKFPVIINTVCIMKNDQPMGLRGVIIDITERKQAEETLKNSEEKYRLLFENISQGFALHEIVLDESGKPTDYRFLTVNPSFEKLTGLQASEIIGKTVKEIIPSIEGNWIDVYGKVALNGNPIEYEDYAQALDRCFNVWAFSPQKGQFAVIVSDITERKVMEQKRRELEERLQRAEKMEALGLLAGGVAHDLNNVLGVMVGYSELLLGRIEESSPVKTYAEKIMEASERAAAVIQDMLTLARRGVQTRHTVNLNTVIIDFLKTPEFLHITMRHPEVEIKTHLDAKPLHILGSTAQLSKTIMNLVSNAAEAMPRGGGLTIKTANQYLDRPVTGYDEMNEGEYVVLSVIDSGEGISQNDIRHIFEPFYTRKVMGKSGTGLGLSVVWGTVKDHNGYINVESKEGVGTTFSLYFPVTREEVSGKKLSIALSDYQGNAESILVVDDVESQRELVQRMLEKLKYQVATVPSGEEAVEYLQNHHADLIVLDMIMEPGMDGLDTYKKIIEIHPRQKAIIVSGFAETERVRQLQALGGGEYVMKPYILETLGLAVKKELGRPPRPTE